jgi:hypothetical protein
MSIIWQSTIIAGLIIAFCWISTLDYAEEQREQAEYCENVARGYWPDYNHNAAEVCQ